MTTNASVKTFAFTKNAGEVVTINELNFIKLGNKSDSAGGRGEVKVCKILAIQRNTFCSVVLATVVGNDNYVVCGSIFEDASGNIVIESTNARIIGQFGFETLEQCAYSLGFSNFTKA